MTVSLETSKTTYDGFITDLSENGILICLHKEVVDIGDFSLKLPIPDSIGGGLVNLSAQQVRIDILSNVNYNEVGCQFINMENEQINKIQSLINLLEKEEDEIEPEVVL